MSKQARSSIRAQLLRLSLAIVAVSVAITLAGTLFVTLQGEQTALDNNLVNSASVLSQSPLLRQALEGEASRAELAEFLDAATANTSDIDLILVGDTQNILRYAPDSAMVGRSYPGDAQYRALAGEGPYTSNETGPLGSEHSAYAPIRNREGQVIGYVVVGLYLRSLASVTLSTVLRVLAMGALAAGVAALLAQRLSRRIKTALLGYEPDAFARRFLQREDILEALEEGILAIDKEARVIFFNAAAAQMLSLKPDAVGRPLRAVYPASTLDRILRTGVPEYNVSMKSLREVQILSDRVPIYEDGKLAGAVGIFRNRTEVARLADDLTGVRHMVDAMRAYTHEFMNKLHVILGYLQTGETEKAASFIINSSLVSSQAIRETADCIRVSRICALVIGKMMHAAELGIRLAVAPDSYCRQEDLLLPEEDYVTIVGNLLENAVEELSRGEHDLKEIRLALYCRPDCNVIVCEDTGGGVDPEIQPHIFEKGVSSKGEGRGLGLCLIHQLVEQHHGTIDVMTEAGAGTCFTLTFTDSVPEEA